MILSQRDPRWRSEHLGYSQLTIGGEGCLTTVLAMINNQFGQNCTPADVAKHHEFYNQAGLILWNNIDMKGAVPQTNPRSYGFDKARILAALLDPINQQVALEVQLSHGTHWLRASGLNGDGAILADDPWFGDNCDIVKRYGAITGAGFFKKHS